MNSFTALLVLTTLLFQTSSYASEGKISGGGGTVVVCKGPLGFITSIHLADFITPEHLNAQERDDFTGLNEFEIVEKILEEIGRSNPLAGSTLQTYKTSLFKEKGSFFKVNPAELKPFDVSDEILRRRDLCKEGEAVETRLVAYQNFFENQVYIDYEIWNHPQFSTRERAALILHEIWYYAFHISQDFTMSIGQAENIYPYVYFFFYRTYEFSRAKLISDSYVDYRFKIVRP